MLDVLIQGGTVVDGKGTAPVRGDVGVRDGRVVSLGRVDEPARRVIDATDLIVAPGFVDAHTHYDAQFFWDPAASVSSNHGVTTVIAGHCGFTLAPINEPDIEYIRDMLAAVEGMSTEALNEGLPWSWRSFGDYLARLEGRIAVNAAFLVGHSAIRRYVMGPGAVRGRATADQIGAMVRALHESLEAGAVGFSSTLSPSHLDGDRQPVPSRHAGHDELLALCKAVGEHEGTWLESAFAGASDVFDDDEADLMVAMAAAARRPINWNLLTIDAAKPSRVERHYEIAEAAKAAGGRVVALTLPVVPSMNVNFRTVCTLNYLPGWGDVLALPIPERATRLRDPGVQAQLLARATSRDAGVLLSMGVADFANYIVGDTYSEANAGLKGRRIGDIALERCQEPFEALIDIVCNDDLATILWPTGRVDDATRQLRYRVWDDSRVLLGGSDAGAHLDRTLNATYPTRFLADVLHRDAPFTLERAVQLLTEEPAQLFGLRDRGCLAKGAFADVVVFDPGTIGCGEPTMVADLPGGARRLVAESSGVVSVLVNGEETIQNGRPTGSLSGSVLRSGADTTTESMGIGLH